MIAEYLEHALQFERMAAGETDPALKESLRKQAVAYRKLARERAERHGLQLPSKADTPRKKTGTSPVAASFIAFVKSTDGAKVIKANGAIPKAGV